MSTLTRLLVSAPILTGSFVLAACDVSYMRHEPTHATTIDAYAIAATMHGAMGAIDGIASRDADVSISGTPSLTVVRIDAEDRAAGKWAMTRFTIRGGLDQSALQPGAHFTYEPASVGSSSASRSPTALLSAVVGCSGPERDQYTYDHAPSHMDVTVERGSTPTALRLVYSANFVHTMGANQTVTGTFEYEPR